MKAGDHNLDGKNEEALFACLVGTIHSAWGPLAASTVMGVLIALGAYSVTGDGLLLLHALAQILIGIGRFSRVADYRARYKLGLTPADIATTDRMFAFWSVLYAVVLGFTCYELAAFGSAESFALSMATCTGFTLAFVTRSAGRPVTLAFQVLTIAGFQIYAELTLPMPHGGVYAALVAGLAIAALVMGKHGYERIVALFQANEANRRLAECDMLTGLKNRHAITGRFQDAIAEGRPFAVYLIDLDRFKEINDTLGHAAGDAVIVEAGRRLSLAAGPGAEVARMGGDEFMALARVDADPGRLLEALTQPFAIGEAQVDILASVGVALFPRHGGDMTELLRHADFALYQAKRDGRARVQVFDDSLRERLVEKRTLEAELETAFTQDQLEVWYQPIQSLGDGAVCGYEALVRWRHPTRGLVPPDVFVPLAEQNGAIERLGEIVLEKACCEAARWTSLVSVAVNMSPQQFRRPEPLVAAVKRALRLSGLAPSRLHLEITESFLMEDTEATRGAINELAALGVKFSLDDFGAGYSSLAYIQAYPFSTLKIDRAFVRNIPADHVSSAIVASVCVLASRIRMTVVAEGVETQQQARALAELGVDLAQGYLYGRPAPMRSANAALKAAS